MEERLKLRECFPVTQNCIYLDNGAKVPLSKPVLKAIEEMNTVCSMSGRDYGTWWKIADDVRGQFAELIGAKDCEIAFASSSTHAVNIIARGICWKAGENVVVAEEEFPSNLYPWLQLQKQGVEIRFVYADGNGETSWEQYRRLCDENTRLVTVSHVQASNGYRIDLEQLGSFCHENRILFFVDATQSCGAFAIDVEKAHIDFLCASTYKWLMGMDGLAVLYCRKKRLDQVDFSYLGWAGRTDRNDYEHHEMVYPGEARKFELGNLNYTAIIALQAALKFGKETGFLNIQKRTEELTAYLKNGLKKIPQLQLSGDFPAERTGALVTVRCRDFCKVHRRLQEKKVLTTLRYNGIRFSPYFYNTEEEIDRMLEILEGCVKNEDGKCDY